MKRALVKTSVIARQKYDYIYYNSIPLSNISYGLICVWSASDTQLIALRQGYDLSHLRLHARQKRKKIYEAIKKAIHLSEVSFAHAFHNRTKISTST